MNRPSRVFLSPSVASLETVLSFSLLSCISHVIITCQYISPDPISLLSTRRIHPTTQSKILTLLGCFCFISVQYIPNYTPAFINVLSQNIEQGNNQIWFLVSNLIFPVLVGLPHSKQVQSPKSKTYQHWLFSPNLVIPLSSSNNFYAFTFPIYLLFSITTYLVQTSVFTHLVYSNIP